MDHSVRTRFILISLGAVAMLLQVTALRAFLSVFSGNELDLGITLAVWLLAVGAGSIAGREMTGPKALGVTVLLAGLLAQPLFSLIPAIRPLLGLAAGETVPFGATMLMTVLLLTPVCMLIGMHFPLAVRTLTNSGPRAFLLEALGAFLAGAAYTFLIAGSISPHAVLAAATFAYCMLGAVLLGRKLLGLLVIVPLIASLGIAGQLPSPAGAGAALVQRAESPYGTIEVFGARGRYTIYSGGKFQYAYPDRHADEVRALLPLSLAPGARRVLVAGGSPGVAFAIAAAPGMTVDFIELDPAMVAVARSLLTPDDAAAVARGAVRFVADDARRHIGGLQGPAYDLIVLNLPEPSTANLNRLYTVEFFREARQALRREGMLSLSLPASFGYVGKRMQAANGMIVASLRAVFPQVVLSSEEYGAVAASDRSIATAPSLLRQRLQERGARFASVHDRLLDDAFDPLKTARHEERLSAATGVNTDDRPIAYLSQLLLWAEMQRSGMLQSLIDNGRVVSAAAALFLAAAGVLAGLKRKAVSFAVFSAGLASMAASIVVLLAYQSAYGSLYERVGVLTALFMAGSAAGAYAARALRRPKAVLMACEALTAGLLLAAPLFFRAEAAFAVLMALCGTLGGAVFAAATNCGSGDAAARAGRLYGIDLAGSFLGALLAALALVPLFGIHAALLGMVLLKMLSLAVLALAGHEQA